MHSCWRTRVSLAYETIEIRLRAHPWIERAQICAPNLDKLSVRRLEHLVRHVEDGRLDEDRADMILLHVVPFLQHAYGKDRGNARRSKVSVRCVTLQIADTICIAITKHGDVDFVDDRIAIPKRVGCITLAGWKRREQARCNHQTGHCERAAREYQRTFSERLGLLERHPLFYPRPSWFLLLAHLLVGLHDAPSLDAHFSFLLTHILIIP